MLKEDLSNIPLITLTDQYHKLRAISENLDQFQTGILKLLSELCDEWKLASKSNWFLQQGVAKFSSLPLSRNETGKISARTLLVKYIKQDPELTALWLIFKYSNRSAIIEGQTKVEARNYCSLVPLIMSSFKKYQNIDYSEWDRSETHSITKDDLDLAMNYDLQLQNYDFVETNGRKFNDANQSTINNQNVTKDTYAVIEGQSFSNEQILGFREIALTPKTGKNAGIPKNPVTTYTIYAGKIPELQKMPHLAKIMLFQTWCANPVNRTKYMILDPGNWDNIPVPLITTEPFNKTLDWSY